MKIAMLVARFRMNKLGGVERDVIEIGKEFLKKGHEVVIISKKVERTELDKEEICGIKIFRVNTINIRGLRSIFSFFKIIKLIKKINADIYNPRDWSPTFPFLFLRKKYIMTSHGILADYEKKYSLKWVGILMERIVFALAKKPIICVQRKSKTDYIKKYKFIILPNGIVPQEFKPSKKQRKGNFLLFVGALDDRKNIKNICKAVSLLNSKGLNLKLKIVGEGPYKEELKEKYSEFEFLGHKKDEELIKLYQKCKFLILPSLSEGFGRVWIEALACGRPIIASRVGEGEYLVKDKDFGRIVEEVSSVKELSEKILSLNKQINKKGVKYKKIRKFVLKNYTWKKIAEDYLKIFKEKISK